MYFGPKDWAMGKVPGKARRMGYREEVGEGSWEILP